MIIEAGICDQQIKASLEAGAYAQQNKIMDANTNQLFWASVHDLTNKPKMQVYKDWMDALWAEYFLRKGNLTKDYDFSSFVPSTLYSFTELQQEALNVTSN